MAVPLTHDTAPPEPAADLAVSRPNAAMTHAAAGERFWVLFCASAFGAFCLGLGDLLNNSNAATVLKLGEIVRQYLWPGLESSGLLALLLLVFLGGTICWLHEPKTRVDAFARGFSVFALLAVTTPYQAPTADLGNPEAGLGGGNPVTAPAGGLSDSASMSGGLAHPLLLTASVVPAAQSGARGQVALAGDTAIATARVHLFEKDGRTPVEGALVTLRDVRSAQVLGSEILSGHVAQIKKPTGTYVVEIEKSGYQRVQFRLALRGDHAWKVELPRTRVPLNLQRLKAARQVEPTPYRGTAAAAKI